MVPTLNETVDITFVRLHFGVLEHPCAGECQTDAFGDDRS